MAMVKNGVASLCGQIAEVLRPARSDDCGKEIGCAVVDNVALSVSRLELQAIGHPPAQLRLQAMIGGRTPRHVTHNWVGETDSRECGIDMVDGLQRFESVGQRIESSLRWSRQVRR